MKITMEPNSFEKRFPSRIREFNKVNGLYEKDIPQDELQIEFEDENCEIGKWGTVESGRCSVESYRCQSVRCLSR